MRDKSVIFWLGLVVVFLVIPLAQHGLPLFWWTFNFMYVNPIGFLLTLAFVVFFFRAMEETTFDFGWGSIGATITGVILILWIIIYKPIMMIGLHNATDYVSTETLVHVTQPRDVSYAEALTNFKGNDPDARYKVGDLDYLEGRWVAEYGPKNFWIKLFGYTQGFYQYLPNSEKEKAPITFQKFPFAETGLLWNSLGYYVHQGNPFVQYETLYLKDPQFEGSYMTVMSLVKRQGWRRIPYVSSILIVHADGRKEMLSPFQAMVDERLNGIQLNPEWLEKLRIEAYGWPTNIWDGLLSKKGRVEIHQSEINAENSPPFHMESSSGSVWVTPVGAYKSNSFFAVAYSQSDVINAQVYIWQKPEGGTFDGIDYLSAAIKAAPHEGENVQWLKLSGDGVRAGQHDTIEMIPLERDGWLYLMAYVSSDPPKTTLFYTIIDAESEEVLENVYSIDDVTRWLNHEIELQPQVRGQSTPTSSNGIDIDSMSKEQLLKLMRKIIDRLEKQ